MSRSGYSDDSIDPLALGRWRAQVASAIRGKRGQEFLQKLIAALDAMPVKELISNDLQADGEFCTLGAFGAAYAQEILACDTYEHDAIAKLANIAPQLVGEVMYLNDDYYANERSNADRERWQYMRNWAKSNLRGNHE